MVVQEAIDILLRHLECLPTSETTERLRAGVFECIRDAGQWSASPSADRSPDALMKRVLALHIEVTKLERDMSFGLLPAGLLPERRRALS
jgi:hypothetical protein